jgi:hypothetical protein
VSRAALLEVCEQAAALRAEIRAWVASPMMTQLRDGLRLFERLSRQQSFWADGELADEQSRRATATRELNDGFEQVRAQAEATEELAFEAYAAREGRTSDELLTALDAARVAFEPLTERLFASRFPSRDAVTLTVVPGRNAQRWARWLVDGYLRWAEARKLRVVVGHLSPKTDEQRRADEVERANQPRLRKMSADDVERTLQQQGVVAAAKLYRDKTGASLKDAAEYVERIKARLEAPPPKHFEWRRDFPLEGEPWVALSLRVFGDAVPMLLSGEHGAHRVYAEGGSFEVKVRFQPGNVGDPGQGEQLEASMPSAEVRRAWPHRKGQEKGLLKDLRTGTEHFLEDNHFTLAPVLAAYIRFVVFGAQEESG